MRTKGCAVKSICAVYYGCSTRIITPQLASCEIDYLHIHASQILIKLKIDYSVLIIRRDFRTIIGRARSAFRDFRWFQLVDVDWQLLNLILALAISDAIDNSPVK